MHLDNLGVGGGVSQNKEAREKKGGYMSKGTEGNLQNSTGQSWNNLNNKIYNNRISQIISM